MQREGKPSPAYPNAGPALLLAGLFFGPFSTTAKPISLLDDSKTNPRAQNCLDAEGPSFRMDKSAVDYRQLRVVGLALPPADHLLIETDRGQFVPLGDAA